MQIRTYSATSDGIDGTLIEVEAALQNALPQMMVTGLPGEVVKESRERVKASLQNMGFQVPTGKILIHLSPAMDKKQGSQFDLSIALLCLQAENILLSPVLPYMAFFGELSLDGRLKPVKGILPMVDVCEKAKEVRQIIIPKENEKDVRFLRSSKIRIASHLVDVIDFVRGEEDLPCSEFRPLIRNEIDETPLFDSIIGQEHAKKAVAVAIAGGHHLLMVGPAGVGKSLIASASPELLPSLNEEEILDLKKIYGSNGIDFEMQKRPFRSPHHGISANALLGGGKGCVTPGEVSLSHYGILFLDEFPEFKRDAIEGLREPMESGVIHVHRVGSAKTLPSQFTLIAAMNPCPCGNAIGKSARCLCRPEKALAYRRKISGAILDRIGLCVVLLSPKENPQNHPSFKGQVLKKQIEKAFERQKRRFKNSKRKNGSVTRLDDSSDFTLQGSAKEVLDDLLTKNEVSYRKISQLKKVSRTIADMDESECIQDKHLWEAWSYRLPDFSRF